MDHTNSCFPFSFLPGCACPAQLVDGRCKITWVSTQLLESTLPHGLTLASTAVLADSTLLAHRVPTALLACFHVRTVPNRAEIHQSHRVFTGSRIFSRRRFSPSSVRPTLSVDDQVSRIRTYWSPTIASIPAPMAFSPGITMSACDQRALSAKRISSPTTTNLKQALGSTKLLNSSEVRKSRLFM